MGKDIRVKRERSLKRYISIFIMLIARTIPLNKFHRAFLYRLAGVKIAKKGNVRVGKVSFDTIHPGDIEIGKGTVIADGCILVTHFYDVSNLFEHAYHRGSIVIGENVYLGSNVVITKPISIGDGAIIAAGSILTKDVEPYTIWGGNPAKFIRSRLEEGQEKPDKTLFKSK